MNPTWYKEAEEMFLNDFGYAEIGRKLSVDRKNVSYWIRKNGHKTPEHKITGPKKPWRKYSLNECLFESIDTEEKAYWLGFLYADGYVSEKRDVIELALAETDKRHLIKFNNFLETERPLGKKIKKMNGKEYIGYRAAVSSKKIKKDLMNKGCLPGKTKKLSFPSSNLVSDKLLSHFIRGYFDGDGSTTLIKEKFLSVEILGTEEFLQGLLNRISLDKNIHSFNHSKTTFRVQIFGSFALPFLETIYKDSTIHLSRKYNIYSNFINRRL